MDRKYLILLLVLILSCEQAFFTEESTSYIVIETDQEKTDLLNGIYAFLVAIHGSDYLEAVSRADDVSFFGRGYYYISDENGERVNCRKTNEPSLISGIPEALYLNTYHAILNANSLIGQLVESEDSLILGESYFLRAYCYFKLARLFGTPPLVKDIDVSYTLEKPSYREVYEFIESDLLKALQLLPDNYLDVRIQGETPHAGSAKALLAEVYLAMAGFPVNDQSKYSQAAFYAEDIIAKVEQYNFSLLEDMSDLWKNTNRHHTENIFGLFFDPCQEQNENMFIGNHKQSVKSVDFETIGKYISGEKFFDRFPDNYRKRVSMMTGIYVPYKYEHPDGQISGNYFRKFAPLENPCEYAEGALIIKLSDNHLINVQNPYWEFSNYNVVTLPLLRYAQTLLTYAESKARAGDLDASCFEAVNMIRRRANQLPVHTPSEFDLPSDLTTGQFLDSVVWERAWELFAEPDGRWFDIIRLDLKDNLAEYHYDMETQEMASPEYLNEDWYFYRIPEFDELLNPNFSDDGM